MRIAVRNTIGYVLGERGRFGRNPFFTVRLPSDRIEEFDRLLAKADGRHRHTTTITVSHQQPDRLRVTEVGPPEYELRAADQYVRGDVIRVQGKEGKSCGLDISARFGVPLIRQQLRSAAERAKTFVELRVPSRKRDLVEFRADVDIPPGEEELLLDAAITLAAQCLPTEDFSDWESGNS